MKQASYPIGWNEERDGEVPELETDNGAELVPSDLDPETTRQRTKRAGEPDYLCPHCHRLLNPGLLVALLVDHEIEQQAVRDLIMLSPVPGEYSMIHTPELQLELGMLYTFRCPLCHADLTSSADERLVEIASRSAEGKSCQVRFSRMFGEHATFIFDSEHMERYGENAEIPKP